MFKILVSDKLEKEGLDILTAEPGFTVDGISVCRCSLVLTFLYFVT